MPEHEMRPQSSGVPLPRYTAPAGLADRIRATIDAERADDVRPTARPPHWRSAGLAAAVAALVAASGAIGYSRGARSGNGDDPLVASHVRSLLADHLMDVASSDRHTVKPWLDARLDYAPPVIDLAADSVPLIGGRLDYLAHRRVAVLVYRRREHLINVYVAPGGVLPSTLGDGAGRGGPAGPMASSSASCTG